MSDATTSIAEQGGTETSSTTISNGYTLPAFVPRVATAETLDQLVGFLQGAVEHGQVVQVLGPQGDSLLLIQKSNQ